MVKMSIPINLHDFQYYTIVNKWHFPIYDISLIDSQCHLTLVVNYVQVVGKVVASYIKGTMRIKPPSIKIECLNSFIKNVKSLLPTTC